MLEAIDLFLEVAAAAGFSPVARARNVPVSSVTRRIDGLEADLGVRLFNRSSRRVALTDAGEQFLPYARSLQAELAEAREAVTSRLAEPRGPLTVTAPAAFTRLHLVSAAASFLQRHPRIELELQVTDQIVDLGGQRADVAIRLGILPDSDLAATRLAPLRRVACASPTYLARKGTPASPADLLDHDCLTLPGPVAPPSWWCFPGLNSEVAMSVDGPLRSNDTFTLLQAALEGMGIVHLSSWLVGAHVAAGSLVVLFPEVIGLPANVQGAIHAVRLPGRSHVGKAQLWIDHLRQHFGQPPYWDRAMNLPAAASVP